MTKMSSKWDDSFILLLILLLLLLLLLVLFLDLLRIQKLSLSG